MTNPNKGQGFLRGSKHLEVPPALPAKALSAPKYPLSAYNMHFQVERKRILEDPLNEPITLEALHAMRIEYKARGKRLHRKSHCFRKLACKVAERWRTLDKPTKKLLQDEAAREKREYAEKHKEWKAAMEALEEENTGVENAGLMLAAPEVNAGEPAEDPTDRQTCASNDWPSWSSAGNSPY